MAQLYNCNHTCRVVCPFKDDEKPLSHINKDEDFKMNRTKKMYLAVTLKEKMILKPKDENKILIELMPSVLCFLSDNSFIQFVRDRAKLSNMYAFIREWNLVLTSYTRARVRLRRSERIPRKKKNQHTRTECGEHNCLEKVQSSSWQPSCSECDNVYSVCIKIEFSMVMQ